MGAFAQFIEELRRRGVYRVVIAYVVGAIALIEAADLVLPRLGVADSVVTGMVFLAVVGLPIALLLAWFYDVTPSGVSRFDPTRAAPPAGVRVPYWAAAGSLALMAAGGWWLGSGRVSGADRDDMAETSADVPVLAVLPFENLSPAEEDALFTDGIHQDVQTHLSKLSGLTVLARPAVLEYRGLNGRFAHIANAPRATKMGHSPWSGPPSTGWPKVERAAH